MEWGVEPKQVQPMGGDEEETQEGEQELRNRESYL